MAGAVVSWVAVFVGQRPVLKSSGHAERLRPSDLAADNAIAPAPSSLCARTPLPSISNPARTGIRCAIWARRRRPRMPRAPVSGGVSRRPIVWSRDPKLAWWPISARRHRPCAPVRPSLAARHTLHRLRYAEKTSAPAGIKFAGPHAARLHFARLAGWARLGLHNVLVLPAMRFAAHHPVIAAQLDALRKTAQRAS